VIAINLAYLDAVEAEDALALEAAFGPGRCASCLTIPTTGCCSGW
jgi:hypothetical protein